jgi:hypothetical protein
MYRRDMSQNILSDEICGHMVGKSQVIFYKLILWEFTATPFWVILMMIVSRIRISSNFIGFENKNQLKL